MKKLYNSKEEKNAARRERRKQSPKYLEELKANRERRRLKKDIYNATARNIKNTNPEQYKKKLLCNKKWKIDHVNQLQEYNKANRRKRQDRQNENRRIKRQERETLLSFMTPTQRNKFLARERKIKAEKKRAAVLAKALKEQADRLNDAQSAIQDIRSQKQELEIRAHEVQREKLMMEVDNLNRIKVDRAVERIISHRENRAYRYRSSAKTCMERVRAAIDDYYQSIAKDNQLQKAA